MSAAIIQIELQYRHLIPGPFDGTSVSALLYNYPWITCQTNKPSTVMTQVVYE